MSDNFGRLYKIAKAYLDSAKDRLGEIDARAQDELSRSATHDDINIPDPPPSSSDDPMERARAKIAAARQSTSARHEFNFSQPPAAGSTTASATPTDPLQTAYKIIGVPPGSDFTTVQGAVTKLRERCAPSRFPDGTQEQAEARMILQRVEEAYQVLTNALSPESGRFDRLEL